MTIPTADCECGLKIWFRNGHWEDSEGIWVENGHFHTPEPAGKKVEHLSEDFYQRVVSVGCDECGQMATNYVEGRDECPTDRGMEIRTTKTYLCDDCREQYERRNK